MFEMQKFGIGHAAALRADFVYQVSARDQERFSKSVHRLFLL